MGYVDYLAGHKVILTVAPTGGVYGKDANPNLPEQPAKIAEQVAAWEDLGTAIEDLRDPRNWALSSAELDAR